LGGGKGSEKGGILALQDNVNTKQKGDREKATMGMRKRNMVKKEVEDPFLGKEMAGGRKLIGVF